MSSTASRILLVERHEDDAHRLRGRIAGGRGGATRTVEVVRATTPKDGRLQLLVGEFDAVLLGVENPELALVDLAALTDRVPDVPVLVYGPQAPEALRDKLLAAGAADYLARGPLTSTEADLVSRCLHYTIDRKGILAELENARRFGQHLAHHDDLTGLPNPRLFTSRLRQLIAQARRYPRQLATLFIDIDRFKPINDSLGPEVGDKLLVAVAERLTGALRESDTVARRSGDEFMVILDGIARMQDAARVAKKIQSVLAHPYILDDRELVLDTSIGISLFPSDGDDVESLVKHAEIAMDRAKNQSGNSIQFYRPDMNESAAERLHLEQALRTAIEREEFTVHYQPQVDLLSGRVSGMEALVRWEHPEEGMVRPDRFIPLAEETGLIVPLGEWVLRTACKQNKAWQDVGLPKIPVAVNLSARQFQADSPTEWIGAALDESGLPPETLDLELTESTVMTNADVAIDTLEHMREIGVRISIDDFGTGHSSLSYLKRFPIHRLKIDKAFVRTLLVDRKDEAITRAIIGMANNLELRAVAEGVETSEQLEFLRGLGCDEVQGYLVSRPMPAEEAGAFLGRGAALDPSLN